MKRPTFEDLKMPEWRKYDPGYKDVHLKEYISKLEEYVDYLDKINTSLFTSSDTINYLSI